MFDFKPFKIIDLDTAGWKLPYRVTFRVLTGGFVEIHKVEAFLEEFQIYVDVTIPMLAQPGEVESFKDKLFEWHRDQEWVDMHYALQRREANLFDVNNDDGPEAA